MGGVADGGFGREAVFHRGGVDVDLERRSGLQKRARGAIELAFAVVAAADHGPHRATILDEHDGSLIDSIAFAMLPKTQFKGFFRGLLEDQVDGGAHDQRVLFEVAGNTLGFLEGPIEKIVRRFLVAAVDDIRRVATGADNLASVIRSL